MTDGRQHEAVEALRLIREARDEVLTAFGEAHTSSVNVTGPSGSGRSAVLRTVVEVLRSQGVPLVELTDDDTRPWVAVGSRADDGQVGSPIFVVDDAHQREPALGAEACQAVRSGRARVLTSTLEGCTPGPMIERIWRDRPVRVITCRPLGVLDCAEVLSSLAGGPVSGETAARVHCDTGGRLALVAEMARRAFDEGLLRRDERGQYRLVRRPSAPWSVTVHTMMQALPDEVRLLLTVLAIADGPVLLSVVETISGLRTVECAVAMGVVAIDTTGSVDRVVHCSAWVASSLRSVVPTETRQKMMSQLGLLTLALPHLCDADLIRALEWRLCGTSVDSAGIPAHLLRAGVQAAIRQDDSRAAGLLLQAAGPDSPLATCDLATLQILSRAAGCTPVAGPGDWGGRPGARRRKDVEHSAMTGMLDRATALYMNRGRFDESERVIGLLTSVAPAGSAVAASASALRCALLLSRGYTTSAVGLSDSLRLDRVETVTIRLACLMYAGRPMDAVRAAHSMSEFKRSDQRFAHFRHVAYSSAAVASAYAGGLPTARRHAESQYETALLDGRPSAAASWGLALGSIHQLAGDVAAAIPPLLDAAGIMEEAQTGVGPAGHAMVLGLLSGLQALSGDVARAITTLDWARQAFGRSDQVPTVLIARGLVAHAEGDAATSATLLQGAARTAAGQGSFLYAAWASFYLAMTGRAVEAARGVDSIARRLQGPALTAVCDVIRCLASESPHAASRLADRLDTLGVLGSQNVLSARDARPCSTLGDSAPGRSVPMLPQVDRDVVTTSSVASLTTRQRQVTLLVADGLSNAQVAGRLGLSRRTVEVHLQLAYSKLGVNDRQALARSAVLLSAAS